MFLRYLEDFPGLVHFIYVDRSSDQVTAPSINTTRSKIRDSRDPCYVIKQKIWDMWAYIHSYLLLGKYPPLFTFTSVNNCLVWELFKSIQSSYGAFLFQVTLLQLSATAIFCSHIVCGLKTHLGTQFNCKTRYQSFLVLHRLEFCRAHFTSESCQEQHRVDTVLVLYQYCFSVVPIVQVYNSSVWRKLFAIPLQDSYDLKFNVSFLCFRPFIDDKLRHNIVKVAEEPRAAATLTKFIINMRTDA